MPERARYTILERNFAAGFVPGCPILYEKSNLLLDNQTRNVLLQAKFRNISRADVKAFIFDVECYDVSNEKLGLVSNYQYLDMQVRPGETFGEKQPIFLNNPVTRKTKVIPKKVVLANGNIWVNGGEAGSPINGYLPLPEQKRISDQLPAHLVEQFKRDCRETKRVTFFPIINKEYWKCCCGQLNSGARKECLNCGIPLLALQDLLNRKALEKRYEAYAEKIRQEQKAAEEKNAPENAKLPEAANNLKEAKKTVRKKTLRIVGIALAALLVLIGFSAVCMPNAREYVHARVLMRRGEYPDAGVIFSQLGRYMNSDAALLQCEYAYGKELLAEGRFADAKAIFRELGAQNYADSTTQSLECDYRRAITLLESGQLDDAKEWFIDLGMYSDSETYVQECMYRKAQRYLENKQYVWASNLFQKLGDYKDSTEQSCESQYQYAQEIMRTSDQYDRLTLAANMFNGIADYKDSAAMVDACKNKWVEVRKSGIAVGYDRSDYLVSLDITKIIAQLLDNQTVRITAHYTSNSQYKVRIHSIASKTNEKKWEAGATIAKDQGSFSFEIPRNVLESARAIYIVVLRKGGSLTIRIVSIYALRNLLQNIEVTS